MIGFTILLKLPVLNLWRTTDVRPPNILNNHKMENFLRTTFQNVRSKKRTKVLHKELLDDVLNANHALAEYDWKFEYHLPVDGIKGTFDIDIAGFMNGEFKVAILAKALNSSINKNVKTYASISIGEAARLMFAPDLNLKKVLFITILPRISPRFNKAKKVTGYDDVKSAKERAQIEHILQAQYGGVVTTIDRYYDITDVNSLESFEEIGIENLDPLVLV